MNSDHAQAGMNLRRATLGKPESVMDSSRGSGIAQRERVVRGSRPPGVRQPTCVDAGSFRAAAAGLAIFWFEIESWEVHITGVSSWTSRLAFRVA